MSLGEKLSDAIGTWLVGVVSVISIGVVNGWVGVAYTLVVTCPSFCM